MALSQEGWIWQEHLKRSIEETQCFGSVIWPSDRDRDRDREGN